ncbi:MAG: hypothetical protein QNK18_00890 [Gammaproteobacteria bacterium]|nr:hypothetical protein [Gammaproteobacteria bacterium]MDJ0889740.1 hypothetical protein [Gammaproteobacteria bacterium]
MRASGALATCVPVKLETSSWQTAFFVRVFGAECRNDQVVLTAAERPLPVGYEGDVIKHQSAAIIVLRLEVHTVPGDPLAAEILLTPGAVPAHVEALRLLSAQPKVTWFFGDQDCRVLYAQTHPLGHDHHAAFKDLLSEAVAHDAMIRYTGRYDAEAALSETVSRYELRQRGHGSAVDQK